MTRPHSSKQHFEEFRTHRWKQYLRRRRIDEDGDADEELQRPDWHTRKRYLFEYARWLRPYLGRLIVVFLLALVGVALAVFKPWFTQRIIDDGVLAEGLSMAKRMAKIHFYGWLLIAVSVAAAANGALRLYQETILNAKLVHRLRQRLFEHLLRLRLVDLQNLKSGGIVSRLSGDVDSTTNLIDHALINPAVALTQTAAAMAIIFAWNWRLASAVLLVLPPLMVLHLLWVRRIRPIYRSMRQDRGNVDARITESFSGIRVVRAFRREAKEERDYAVGHHTVIRKTVLAQLIRLVVRSGWGLMMPGVTIVIVWYGGYLVIQDRATVGQLFAFQWYVFLVIQPVLMMVEAMTQTQAGLAAMERIFDMLAKQEDKPDAPGALAAPAHVESVQLDHVWFEYHKDLPVLEDVTFETPGGSVVALVGPSGAGKSTLVDLLARFHDPTAGAIRLNGIDLRELRLASYRELLAVVQQDVFLFDGSVRENIGYGRRGASDDEVIDAARRANAHQFIVELPHGYDTMIGERGVKLSGGQRQRLSIARAVLADPRILILDEATSNLDTESEQLIQAALEELYRSRTTFVIAHRLSTVTHADMIVVLDRGRVVEMGNHEQLIAQGDMYAQMVDRQRQAFGDVPAVQWDR